jgi:hypothetical protein
MRSPYSDPRLSLKARGLYSLYVETGRVLSADEISAAVPEGRDSIRAAMKELKVFNYIKAVRHQVGGQWRTHLKFTDEDLNTPFGKTAGHTDDGFPGVGKPGVLYIDSYKTIATSNNIDTVTNVTVSIGAEPQTGKESEMSWANLDEEEPKPKLKRKLRLDTEDDSGAVGKVVDKVALRREKYKKTSFDATSETFRRSDRPEDTWTTADLVAEFYGLSRSASQGAPGQNNGKELITWINKNVGEGTPRLAILKAIRMFFDDPRLTRDPGIGLPMWKRFMAYYPTVHGIVTRTVEQSAYVDEDFLMHQEKMLRLLGGK